MMIIHTQRVFHCLFILVGGGGGGFGGREFEDLDKNHETKWWPTFLARSVVIQNIDGAVGARIMGNPLCICDSL